MKKLLLALALFLLPAAASAQCTGVFPASTTCGSVAGGVAGPIPFSTFTGLVASVTAADGTLTISPNVGAVIAGINLGNANTWSATQTFPNNSLILAELPQGIANSIWINPTGSLANMQNVAVPSCANDGKHGLVYVNGSGLACSTLTTYVSSVTCGTGLTGGTITSTGTCAFGFSGATVQASPGNPTATSSTTGVMMGIGTTCHITPAFSTRVLMQVQGQMSNTTTGISASVSLRFGTGTAPVNGAAPSGSTLTPGILSGVNPANYSVPFNIGGIAGGLTPGTAVWIDVVLAAGANTAAISNLSCYALEF